MQVQKDTETYYLTCACPHYIIFGEIVSMWTRCAATYNMRTKEAKQED